VGERYGRGCGCMLSEVKEGCLRLILYPLASVPTLLPHYQYK
jgi:hypothetical protein